MRKHVPDFQTFRLNESVETCEATGEEKELFKRMVKTFTADGTHLDIEDETALLALCRKMGLNPTDVHKDNLIKNFRTSEAVISHRTEEFLNKVICNYAKDGIDAEEEKVLKELCSKLGEDFSKMIRACKRK